MTYIELPFHVMRAESSIVYKASLIPGTVFETAVVNFPILYHGFLLCFHCVFLWQSNLLINHLIAQMESIFGGELQL